ncbi:SMP-30/gluconolactonase/LRE family protein [Phaeobacter sp. 11ANDIMAR09]|uniref:SMP-30/gluconolactonase/LRE family protein n=1 Tax=Phaeobacter sp. 11ANDIMAR09 TaxID=1225647 RepID=UPI0006C8D414|nr:SMP-30/gluconolactonase/LRE family protein [Phaeobacter sp. 11ANDIMAR09]KPD11772.1 gluconolactonase [Phaeobacter sp. 11ANDIMAR09]
MTPSIFDSRSCTLGEGPLWHPLRQQLFWFDIMGSRLMSRHQDQALDWQFGRHVSAAGWLDREHLLIASETGLSRFNLSNRQDEMLCPIEADRTTTRSNDGRADPWGGFWVGTMGKGGEFEQGTLYRWFNGELRILQEGLTTPNSICFDKARNCAYYSDTKTRLIWRQPLDPNKGWPIGERSIFLDLTAQADQMEYKPDGAVIDAEGCLWSAQWGAARVARYSPNGDFLRAIDLPTGHTSCPAFGSATLDILFITTATQKLPDDATSWRQTAGQTFAVKTNVQGVAEPQVLA